MLNKKQIIEFISEQLGVNKDACTPTANFINDLGADSLDLIEMVMELEEQAHISISDEELNDLKIKTIGDVFSYLESKGLLVRTVMQKYPNVLDACCGGRMFWWNKQNSDVLYMDNRIVEKGAFQNNWNPNWCVNPDEIADFRDMPFPDNVFKMVVFDPPHLTSGSMKSVINKKYGLLNKDTWKDDIVSGFKECWRVLAHGGVLIFKWNEANIKAKDLLRAFPVEPLFGDFTGKTGSTIWVTFLKA